MDGNWKSVVSAFGGMALGVAATVAALSPPPEPPPVVYVDTDGPGIWAEAQRRNDVPGWRALAELIHQRGGLVMGELSAYQHCADLGDAECARKRDQLSVGHIHEVLEGQLSTYRHMIEASEGL